MQKPKGTLSDGILEEEAELEFLSCLVARICKCMDRRVDETAARILVETCITETGLDLDAVPKLVSEIKLSSMQKMKKDLH
jgi:hypothetical protein